MQCLTKCRNKRLSISSASKRPPNNPTNRLCAQPFDLVGIGEGECAINGVDLHVNSQKHTAHIHIHAEPLAKERGNMETERGWSGKPSQTKAMEGSRSTIFARMEPCVEQTKSGSPNWACIEDRACEKYARRLRNTPSPPSNQKHVVSKTSLVNPRESWG
jgi:hypothetical protein